MLYSPICLAWVVLEVFSKVFYDILTCFFQQFLDKFSDVAVKVWLIRQHVLELLLILDETRKFYTLRRFAAANGCTAIYIF